jgi:hypothetical protein
MIDGTEGVAPARSGIEEGGLKVAELRLGERQSPGVDRRGSVIVVLAHAASIIARTFTEEVLDSPLRVTSSDGNGEEASRRLSPSL